MTDRRDRWLHWKRRLAEANLPNLYDTEEVAADDKVVRFRVTIPGARAVWLLVEYDPERQIGFGWCDLGIDLGEWGYVFLPELANVEAGPPDNVLRAVIDESFVPTRFGDVSRQHSDTIRPSEE